MSLAPALVLALAVYMVGTLTLFAIEQRALARLEHRALIWLAEHAYLPLARFLLLGAFILLCHPALFARPDLDLPGPVALLAAQPAPWADLNLLALFLVLLLPMALGISRRSTLLLGLQALALVALLARWTALATGAATPSWLWPGYGTALAIGVLFIAGESVGLAIHNRWAVRLEHPLHRAQAENLVGLAVQAPVALAYGAALGERLG